MNAIIEHLPIGVGLPRPLPGRMRPLRAGIRNVWEYDNQEFWFAEGRLILRGQNTAGKSKALELLLPFVLDGEIRSERLDPFGSQAKTMYWNLIDFADRPSAIGYCWLEFGQIDADGAERFTTCIVGLRASRSAGRRVETWFAVTPARVGSNLDLAPRDVPLTAERLRAALAELDERSVVSTVLTLGLRPDPVGPLTDAARRWADGATPLPIPLAAVQVERWQVPPGTTIWTCENPSVLAAAVGTTATVICLEGRPSLAAVLLVLGLINGGALVRYHGDFGSGGISIANEVIGDMGATPWRFGVADHQDALRRAALTATDLRPLRGAVPDACWDPELAPSIRGAGVEVEEEFVIDLLLSDIDQAEQLSGACHDTSPLRARHRTTQIPNR